MFDWMGVLNTSTKYFNYGNKLYTKMQKFKQTIFFKYRIVMEKNNDDTYD